MFERHIYSDPRATGIEIHAEIGKNCDNRKCKVVENGIAVDEELLIPDGLSAPAFIQGFFAGCAYSNGELRKLRVPRCR